MSSCWEGGGSEGAVNRMGQDERKEAAALPRKRMEGLSTCSKSHFPNEINKIGSGVLQQWALIE